MRTAPEQLWNEATAAVEKLPVELMADFAHTAKEIADNSANEPEKVRLKREIETVITNLQETWLNFPRDWKREDLHEVCHQSRYVWNMVDRLADVEKAERKSAAMAEAQATLEGGCKFEKINLDGFAFIVDARKIREMNNSDIPI